MHVCFKDTTSIRGFSQGHVYPYTTELVEYVHTLRKCQVAGNNTKYCLMPVFEM